MNFTVIRAAVVDISNFVVGYCAWVALYALSVGVVFGDVVGARIATLWSAFTRFSEAAPVQKLIEDYELQSLAPALAVFVSVFLLHNTVSLATAIGRFTPPSVSAVRGVGMRAIHPGDWATALGRVRADVSLHAYTLLVEQKVERLRESELYRGLSQDAWNIRLVIQRFRFGALLNLVVLTIGAAALRFSPWSLVLLVVCVLGAAFATFVQLYKELQLEDQITRDAVRAVSFEDKLFVGDDAASRRSEIYAEAAGVLESLRRQPAYHWDWELPFFGTAASALQRLRAWRAPRSVRASRK